MIIELFIGINKQGNLQSVEYDDEREYFSLSGSEYESPLTEGVGRDNAIKTLKDSDYWLDIGAVKRDSLLLNYVDWERLAEDTITSDGWANVNGDYQSFGEFFGVEWFCSLSSRGQHDWEQESIKHWFIPEKDAKRILKFWEECHLKDNVLSDVQNARKFMRRIIEENKLMTDRVEILKKYFNSEGVER